MTQKTATSEISDNVEYSGDETAIRQLQNQLQFFTCSFAHLADLLLGLNAQMLQHFLCGIAVEVRVKVLVIVHQ